MSESYTSSRNGDISPNGLGNGSNPSLVPTQNTSAGISSVIRKKLMGYVGFANLPNQVHRKSVRKGFQFTAMVVGTFTFVEPSFSMLIASSNQRRVGPWKIYLDKHPLPHYLIPPEGAATAFS